MRILILTILTLLILCRPSYGQPARQQIVMLSVQLQQSKPDSNRIILLNKLGRYYVYSMDDYDSRVKKDSCFNMGVGLLKKSVYLSDSLHLAAFRQESICVLGSTLLNEGYFKEGKEYYMQAIGYCRTLADKKMEAETWLRYVRSIRREEPNYAELYRSYDSALALSRQIASRELEATIRVNLGDLYFIMNKMDLAKNELLHAAGLYESTAYKKLCDLYYMLSVVNRSRGEYNQALGSALKCVQTMETLKDSSSAEIFWGEVGLVYEGLEKPVESIYWYKKALLKREQDEQTALLIYRTAGFLVQQLIKIKKEKEALSLMQRLVKKYASHTVPEKIAVDQNLAYCYDALKEDEIAEKYYVEMLREYLSLDFDDGFMTIGYCDVGRFYLSRHKYEKARPFLRTALKSSSEMVRKKDIHLMLFTADSAMGDYISAIQHLEMHQLLNDSVFNERKSKQVEELQIKYQTSQREKDIMLLNNQSKIQQNEIQRSALIRNIIIAGVLLLAGFAYNRYRVKQKSNEQLELQQKVINQKNASLQELVEEKEWLIKEIHHRVKNNFHMVIGLLGTQSGYLKNEEAIHAMEDSQHRIHAMSLIHQKLYQSDNLSAINMSEYIHELVEYLRDSFDTHQCIIYDVQVERVILNVSQSIPIGLILNEAITNAIKYAFPGSCEGKISISLKCVARSMLLTISDNGVGIPAGFDQQTGSMGMNLMQGLCEDLNGRFTIANDNGTVIRIRFEYEAASEESIINHETSPA